MGELVTTIPTIGLNVESIKYQNVSFTVWDVGGQDKIRTLWRYYFDGTQVSCSSMCRRLSRLGGAVSCLVTDSCSKVALWSMLIISSVSIVTSLHSRRFYCRWLGRIKTSTQFEILQNAFHNWDSQAKTCAYKSKFLAFR